MNTVTRIDQGMRSIAQGLRRFACMYAVGGPVGAFHTWKLARLRKRMAKINEYISREKDLHRDHLRTLNFEFTEAQRELQATNIAAAQFWSDCERWAGSRS